MAMPTGLGHDATGIGQSMFTSTVVEPGFFRKDLVLNAYEDSAETQNSRMGGDDSLDHNGSGCRLSLLEDANRTTQPTRGTSRASRAEGCPDLQ